MSLAVETRPGAAVRLGIGAAIKAGTWFAGPKRLKRLILALAILGLAFNLPTTGWAKEKPTEKPTPSRPDPKRGKAGTAKSKTAPNHGSNDKAKRSPAGAKASAHANGKKAALSGPVGASAHASEPKTAEHKAALSEIHGKLENLKKDLAKSEESHASVVDQLKDTETAISSSNRRLRELGSQRNSLETEISQLEGQSDRLGKQIENQQRQLGKLLYRRYVHGEDDALKLLLSGEDPNRIAQDQYFLTQLSRAKAVLLGQLRESLKTKQTLAETRRDRAEALEQVSQAQKESRDALVGKQQERQQLLASLADKISAQRHQIDVLKADEQRLSKLVEALARAPKPAPPPAKAETGVKPGKQEKPRNPPASNDASPAEKPALRNEALPDASDGSEFAALKGRLRLPVRGEITGRFGAPRADGGAQWKGIFIRVSEGSEVHAVAAGKVVFADWLRGFGNLIIVDHGGAYLSIYGNNQSLFRQTGHTVKSGETIAAAGNSGGQGESGLYFELRHQGQAIDPLKWASLR